MPIVHDFYYFSHNEQDFSRPAVVLLHGAGGSHLYWPPEIRRLPGQRILAPDLPGHGKSDGIGRQSIAEYAQDVLDFLDALKIRKAVFVGHSMGGAIALALAIHHPSRTLGLGLVATAPRLRVSPLLMENCASPATFPLAVEAVVKWSFSPKADARLREMAQQRMAESRSSVFHGDFLACEAFDESGALGRIKVPTLILCGTEDKMTPLHFSEQMQRRIKNSLLHKIDGAGHMLMLEEAAQTASLLQVFLDGIVYQPGVV
ncbi:MAG: alpha/beta hydrolase [Anaerolineales bacterium]